MERITLVVEPMSMHIESRAINKSRPFMRCDVLEIYVIGKLSVARMDAAFHMCFQEALARHIPLISLRRS